MDKRVELATVFTHAASPTSAAMLDVNKEFSMRNTEWVSAEQLGPSCTTQPPPRDSIKNDPANTTATKPF